MEEIKPAGGTTSLTLEVATVAKDILRPAYGGVMYPADDVLALKGGGRGLAVYDDLERDPWVYACLHKRKMAVIGRAYYVEPFSDSRQDKKAADLVREQLSALDFDTASYHWLDAILKGRSTSELMYGRDGATLRVTEVKPKDARRFTFDENSELRLLTVAHPVKGEEVPPRKFITHRFGAKDGNPHGLGLGSKLWWPVFFKRQGLSFWLQFLDKFGAPTAVGKYVPGVQVAELEAALARIAHDAGVAIPEGASVELLEAGRSGTGTHDTMVRYMDEQIAAAILGDGGGRGSGGELASAAILRNELRLELVKADADLLSGTLNQTLARWIVELNMPSAKPPRIWREVKEEEDLKARAERDKILYDMGFQPTEDYVRETYGGQWKARVPAAGTMPPPQNADPAQFAEGAPFADQHALDAAIEALPPEVMQGQMQQLLGGVLAALEKADGFDAAIALLAQKYPDMPGDRLEKLLSQAIFSASLWGEASAAEG